MILITGATGFVGRSLVKRLGTIPGVKLRLLLSTRSDPAKLPTDISYEIAVGHISDPDTMREAMQGIHTVIHLVGTETRGRHSRLEEVDIEGVRSVVDAARGARVGRIIYVSRLGADKASAYRIQRAKGVVEEIVRDSGLSYTIFQTGLLFGEGDRFSEHIAMLARSLPVYFLPGDGDTVLQPLWVEDLVTCIAMSLENLNMLERIVSVGGPELLTYRRMVLRVMHAVSSRRPLLNLPFLVVRVGAWFLDGLFVRWPFTEQWVEMLAANQAAELGSIERAFGFRPASFDIGLIDTYLAGKPHFFRLIWFIFTQKW